MAEIDGFFSMHCIRTADEVQIIEKNESFPNLDSLRVAEPFRSITAGVGEGSCVSPCTTAHCPR